jgi:hypothetical protein
MMIDEELLFLLLLRSEGVVFVVLVLQVFVDEPDHGQKGMFINSKFVAGC